MSLAFGYLIFDWLDCVKYDAQVVQSAREEESPPFYSSNFGVKANLLCFLFIIRNDALIIIINDYDELRVTASGEAIVCSN